jgi:hypothetical protein
MKRGTLNVEISRGTVTLLHNNFLLVCCNIFVTVTRKEVSRLCSFVQLNRKFQGQQDIFICSIQNCHEFQLKMLRFFSCHNNNLPFIISQITKHSRMSTLKTKVLMSNYLHNFILFI